MAYRMFLQWQYGEGVTGKWPQLDPMCFSHQPLWSQGSCNTLPGLTQTSFGCCVTRAFVTCPEIQCLMSVCPSQCMPPTLSGTCVLLALWTQPLRAPFQAESAWDAGRRTVPRTGAEGPPETRGRDSTLAPRQHGASEYPAARPGPAATVLGGPHLLWQVAASLHTLWFPFQRHWISDGLGTYCHGQLTVTRSPLS